MTITINGASLTFSTGGVAPVLAGPFGNAPMFAARAWACTGDANVLYSSGNVSSVAEPAAHLKQINFSNSLGSTTAAVLVTAMYSAQLYGTVTEVTAWSATAAFSDDPSFNNVSDTSWVVFR